MLIDAEIMADNRNPRWRPVFELREVEICHFLYLRPVAYITACTTVQAVIHWSSGSHKRSTNWANRINYNFGGAPTGGGPGPCPLDPPKSGPAYCIIASTSVFSQ